MHEALLWTGYQAAALVKWFLSLPAAPKLGITVVVVVAVAGYFDWCDRMDRTR